MFLPINTYIYSMITQVRTDSNCHIPSYPPDIPSFWVDFNPPSLQERPTEWDAQVAVAEPPALAAHLADGARRGSV